ncbi:MAG: metallophosphoesterase, partial [Gammaproteobacteria bacterium]
MGYDLIGDIHGEAPTLRAMLEKLGYRDTATGYAHPDNRIVIFVGDLVDRGLW